MGAFGSKPANAPRTNVRSNSGVNTTGAGAPPAVALSSTATNNSKKLNAAFGAPNAQAVAPQPAAVGGRRKTARKGKKASRKAKKSKRAHRK
jgi:hypothetical protein